MWRGKAATLGPLTRYGMIAICSVAAFATMFVGASTKRVTAPWIGSDQRDSTEYLASYRNEAGQQVVMVFIGAKWCHASTSEGLDESVKEIKRRLSGMAQMRGWSFVAHGIALDWVLSDGVEFLTSFGEFDEISVGYSWANRMLLHYVWSQAAESASVPQVLVFKRHLRVPTPEDSTESYSTTDENLIFSIIGSGAISEWADGGTRLPAGWDGRY